MTTSNERLMRADVALAQLASNGGLLNPEQTNTFLDIVQEQPTILRDIRMVRMAAPQMKINKIGLAGRILRAATETGGMEDNGTNDRWLSKANRSAPVTSQVALQTSEVIAEVRIPYEVMEDNIEGDNFEEHVMRLIAERCALDLEELALFGDTTNAVDPYLALMNGYFKLASLHIVDNANAGPSDALITNGLLAMPQKYLRNLPGMRGYMSIANKIKFQTTRMQRFTTLGDASIQGNGDLYSQGLKIEPVNTIAADGSGKQGLITFPQNLIMGIQRQITVETDKDIRAREYVIVVTARVATQVEDNRSESTRLNS